MANATVNTGQGTTAVFTALTFVSNVMSIDIGSQAIPPVDSSHLASSGFRSYFPGDLATPGQWTIPYQFDSQAALPVIGSVDTLTITLPLGGTETVNGTLVATGFIADIKLPNFQTDTIQEGAIIFQCDGLTGPTYTPATII